MMMSCIQRLLTAGLIAMTLQPPAAMAQAAFASPVRISVPPVPREIEVPAGNTAFLIGHAVGTQNYICQVSGSTFSWTFLGPQATLFFGQWDHGGFVQQIATHYLSLNPLELSTARPTWQSSSDTSAVWGAPVSSSTDANFVEPDAIPWLLLQAVGRKLGPAGGWLLAQSTYIQRLNTSGGVRPSTGCSDAGTLGQVRYVPYTADYYFYRASR